MSTIPVGKAEEIAAALQELYERTGLWIEACSCCNGITVTCDGDAWNEYDRHRILLDYKLDRYIVDAAEPEEES